MKMYFLTIMALPFLQWFVSDRSQSDIRGLHNGGQLSSVCASPDTSITDVDGNKYPVVTIGSQLWTVGNLRTSHYANGDPISNLEEVSDWSESTTGAFCYYDNSTDNESLYGKLYNGYAVVDPRGLAPRGWHVATADDVNRLLDFLGGPDYAGARLKSVAGWKDGSGNDANGNNNSGFAAIPAGYRRGNGTFMPDTNVAAWYTSSWHLKPTQLVALTLQYDPPASTGPTELNFGYSIRLVKDVPGKH